ncbi:hypothetical protein PbJCM13498_40540 [Prolixibacter bellariivorans]|uniref:Uncharacterized protein n=1 Tax=Prolixibacter bellariivorans TaxID=314319 RepID=A0A5M4B5M5_9BACT|nr:hypothetical protein PbJCM13498_40540 [Prolixibacter bellariivorans]
MGQKLIDLNLYISRGKFFIKLKKLTNLYWRLFVELISFLDIDDNVICYIERFGSRNKN